MEEKYTSLLEQLARQNAAAQGQGYQAVQEAGAQVAQASRELLTAEERQYFETAALTNPAEAFDTFARLIQERSVKQEVERARQELRQEMQGYVNQFGQALAPMALQNYKAQAFNTPQSKAIEPIFDELVQAARSADANVVNNPQQLDLLRQVAIGRAYEQGMLQQSSAPQVPFSESAGSIFSANQRQQQQAASAHPDAIEFGRRLGLSPDVINKVDNVFTRNGVYRNEF